MRIGILTHNYPKTSLDRRDAGIFIYDFAQELSKKVKVYIFCLDSEGRKKDHKRVPVTWFAWSGGSGKLGSWNPANPLSVVRFFELLSSGKKAVLDFVKKNNIDFCLACWALPSGLFAEEVKRKMDVPYATWSLGSDINTYAKYPILKQLIKTSLVKADARFANSYLLCNKIKDLCSLPCEFLPAITDFNTQEINTKLAGDKFNFLFVGRLEKVKGPDILIKACRLLKDYSDKFTVTFLGGGSMDSKLRQMVKNFGLERQVKFEGWADKEKVSRSMLAADCLIISSRNESLPLVVIEAARVRLPIVAFNVGDCKRLIKNYNIGFVAQSGSEEGLYKVMKKALAQGENFKKQFLSGLDQIAREFTQEKAVDILLRRVKFL